MVTGLLEGVESGIVKKLSGPRLELRTYCAHMSVRQL